MNKKWMTLNFNGIFLSFELIYFNAIILKINNSYLFILTVYFWIDYKLLVWRRINKKKVQLKNLSLFLKGI